MPVITHNSLNAAAAPMDENSLLEEEGTTNSNAAAAPSNVDLLGGLVGLDDAPAAPATSTNNALFDLMGAIGGGATITSAPAASADLLSALGGVSISNPLPTAAPVKDAFDLLGGLGGGVDDEPDLPAGVIALNTGGVEAQICVEKPWSGEKAQLRVVFSNNTPIPIQNFAFQAAVTKAYEIELQPATSSTLPPDGDSSVYQLLTVTRKAQGQALRMRARATYSLNGASRTIEGTLDSIPGL